MNSPRRRPTEPPDAHSLQLAPRWGQHRSIADAVARALGPHREAAEMLQRMAPCAQRLGLRLSWAEGEAITQQVASAHFCQQRFCPICDWRRTVAWRRRLLPGLDAFHEERKTWRPLFLTLTVKNCPLNRTAQTIREMHEGWGRLTKRAEFPSPYWLRRTEITVGNPCLGDDGAPKSSVRRKQSRPKKSESAGEVRRAPYEIEENSETAQAASQISQSCDVPESLPLRAPGPDGQHWLHPHIHALVLVPPSYWSTGYVKQSRWRELWMDCARLDYAPVVDVRRGYVRDPEKQSEGLHLDAAIEASKYISKHTELLSLGPAIACLQQEIKGQRMIAVSGGLSPYVKPEDPAGSELTDQPELIESDSPMADVFVQWDAAARSYVQSPQ